MHARLGKMRRRKWCNKMRSFLPAIKLQLCPNSSVHVQHFISKAMQAAENSASLPHTTTLCLHKYIHLLPRIVCRRGSGGGGVHPF